MGSIVIENQRPCGSVAFLEGAKPVSHRESTENYAGELFRMGRYRVAVCKDGQQWLYQRQRPRFLAGGAAWDTLGYCVSRNGLTRLHRSYTGADAVKIAHLPAFFSRKVQDDRC